MSEEPARWEIIEPEHLKVTDETRDIWREIWAERTANLLVALASIVPPAPPRRLRVFRLKDAVQYRRDLRRYEDAMAKWRAEHPPEPPKGMGDKLHINAITRLT